MERAEPTPHPARQFRVLGSGLPPDVRGPRSRAGWPHAVDPNQRRHRCKATKHRSTRRALERPAPQDGHLRMARVRGPRLHGRQERRHRRRSTQEQAGVGESGQAAKIVDGAFPDEGRRAGADPEQDAQGRDARSSRRRSPTSTQRLEDTKGVQDVVSPYDRRTPTAVSADGHSALVDLRAPRRRRGRAVESSVDALARRSRGRAAKAHPELRVEQFGRRELREGGHGESSTRTWARPTLSSLPMTLIILVFAFGALVAAGIPLLLALTGVVGTMGLRRPGQPARAGRRTRSSTSSCSSAWPWASTTRCSTCGGRARSAPPDATTTQPSRPPRRPRDARC